MKRTTMLFIAMLVGVFSQSQASDDKIKAQLQKHATEAVVKWVHSPEVYNMIIEQNKKNSSLTQAQIDTLDKQWRAETKAGSKPMIDKVLANSLSKYLTKVKTDSKGLYTEIFVMDNKGLNVGQSDVTSDYWQGDEAKWKQTFSVGANAVHVGKIKKDESTQQFQSQVSVSVVDPKTKAVIGAVTVGINVDNL